MKAQFDLWEANALYGFALVLMLISAFTSETLPFALFALVVESLVFLGPLLFMGKYLGIDLKKALGLRQIKKRQYVYGLLFYMALFPLTIALSLVNQWLLNLLHWPQSETVIQTAGTLGALALQILIIAVLTGICEELFFRGMLLGALHQRTHNAPLAIGLSSFLFAVMHFDVVNFLVPLFLGIVFGHIVLMTRSVTLGILGHIMNNGLILIVTYGSSKISALEAPENSVDLLSILGEYWQILAFSSVCLFCFYWLMQKTAGVETSQQEPKERVLFSELMINEPSMRIPLAVLMFYIFLAFTNIST